jgi:hypothetical protein
MRKHVADPTPTVTFKNPTPEQAFLAKNNDREHTTRQLQPAWHLLHSHRDICSVGRLPRRALGSSSFSLPVVECALAEMEGRSTGATLGGLGRRAGA